MYVYIRECGRERAREKEGHRFLFEKPTMLHTSSRVLSTAVKFLNVIFLIFLPPYTFALRIELQPLSPFSVSSLLVLPVLSSSFCSCILEHILFLSLLFPFSFSISSSSLPFFLCIQPAVRTSLRTFMIPCCVSSILSLCPARPSLLSQAFNFVCGAKSVAVVMHRIYRLRGCIRYKSYV